MKKERCVHCKKMMGNSLSRLVDPPSPIHAKCVNDYIKEDNRSNRCPCGRILVGNTIEKTLYCIGCGQDTADCRCEKVKI